MLGHDVLTHARKIGQVAGNRIGLGPHVRHHGAECNRGAQGGERIIRLHQQSGRRLLGYALESSEDFHDRAAPFVQRLLKNLRALIERLQPRLICVDLGLDLAHARRGSDQLLIERTAVLAQHPDLLP